MSYGLRVWDASGNLKLEVSDRLAKFLGAVVLPDRYVGSVACPNVSSVTTWVAYAYRSGHLTTGESVHDRFSYPIVPGATSVYVPASAPWLDTGDDRALIWDSHTVTIYFWGY